MKDEPALRKILYPWPAEFDNTKAGELGFVRDTGFDWIVRDYVEGLAPKARQETNGCAGEKTVNVKVQAVEVLT
jgi:hypothetical protein